MTLVLFERRPDIIHISHGRQPPLALVHIHKRNSRSQKVMEDDEDHISKLPNSVLSTILSSLKVREAVRTSVISTRWRYLWTTPTNLIFDAHNMLEKEKYSGINVRQMLCWERCLIKNKRTVDFILNVNQFLSCLGEVQKIEKLKVFFTFRHNMFEKHLHRWIGFALSRNVKEIDLCLLEEHHFSAPKEGELYVFPCGLLLAYGSNNSSLKRLRLAHCMLAPSRSIFTGFSTLTTLDLMIVNLVSENHIQNLLSNCHSLEWLSFSECYNMDYLKIEHPFCQKLKYLNVNDCFQLRAIELKGINVEILEYKGWIIEFVFSNSPRLRTVFSHVRDWRLIYSDIWPLSRLPIDLPQVETLFLESSCYMAGIMSWPTFTNLRHLIILKVAIFQHDLSWITTVLKACPTLQRLELHLRTYYYVDEELREINWPPTCPHNQLNEVVISGLRGSLSEIEIAIYLLKNATELTKMTIDPRQRVYLGNGKWHLSEACESWTRIGRQKVYEHLIQEVPPPAELLVL